MRNIAILVALAVSACGTNSSGVVPIGPDTYMIGGEGGYWNTGGANVAATLFKEANAFCAQQGKTMSALGAQTQDMSMGNWASAGVRFRCD